MKTGIDNKVALVTASTQGIGFATARLLAEEGAAVWVHGRGGDNLQHALQRIRQAVPDARVNASRPIWPRMAVLRACWSKCRRWISSSTATRTPAQKCSPM